MRNERKMLVHVYQAAIVAQNSRSISLSNVQRMQTRIFAILHASSKIFLHLFLK